MIEPAYAQLADLVTSRLRGVIFDPDWTGLRVDPPAPFAAEGNERSVVYAASLVKVRTGSVRQLIGLARPRHVVERQCQVELAVAGPAKDAREYQIEDAVAALAALPADYPTLGGYAERLILGERTDDELAPNGLTVTLNFTIRVRSGDPLGATP